MQVLPEITRFTAIENAQSEFRTELKAIADWWVNHSIDLEQGGFFGEVDAQNCAQPGATKGIILNARILWFFSETALHLESLGSDVTRYKEAADRAYEYIIEYFIDPEFGGVYWELDALGNAINTKKQIYAQAFTLYALAAYFQITRKNAALELAWELFHLIELHGIDREQQGYLEAFTREWGVIADLRLSEKDLNYPKSQNTHLHVMEAYTALHAVTGAAESAKALRYNIELLDRYIINKSNSHLRMFLSMDWQDHSPGFTYGHDIEAAWLIARALEVLGDESFLRELTPNLLKIVDATYLEAMGEYGQVKDAYDFASGTVNSDHVWWVQAEAMVGFLYAFQETKEHKYLDAAEGLWQFIKLYQRDSQKGEWFWLSTLNQENPRVPTYKAGFWKCPYHNGRAMIEADKYLWRIKNH